MLLAPQNEITGTDEPPPALGKVHYNNRPVPPAEENTLRHAAETAAMIRKLRIIYAIILM